MEVLVVMAVTIIPPFEAAIQDLSDRQVSSYFWQAIILFMFSACSV